MATSKKTSAGKPGDIAAKIPPHRIQFKQLMLGNPNYFGSFPDLNFKAVKPQSYDTVYEELVCLGLSPEQARLEAVVNIKQHAGYHGDACGSGSVEYVRFFVQHPGGWQDLGSTSFNVFDLAASPLPLSYAASIAFDEPRKFCFAENILNVRAILSWEIEPPPGNPGFVPPWGNVVDARVQVAKAPFDKVPIKDLITANIMTLDAEAAAAIDLTLELPAKAAQPLGYAELKALYADSKVPGHRFGLVEAQKLLHAPILSTLPALKPVPLLPKAARSAKANLSIPTAQLTAGAEMAEIIAAISVPKGDTAYEELSCAGYNPQTRELEAVIRIKLNAGYSGGLCTPGSREYVSFHAFFGGAWHTLGTTSVTVHDLAAVAPGKPLAYAVRMISNLTELPCQDLTGVPLRAILSWQVAPTGVNFVPVWGNIVNTHVQPQIGVVEPGNNARLMRLGGVTVSAIDDVTGLADNHAGGYVTGDCSAYNSPFGGEVMVEGDFTPKVDVFNHVTGNVIAGQKPIIYQAWVTRTDVSSAPFQLTNPFTVAVFPPNPPNPAFPAVIKTQSVLPAPGPIVGGVPGTQYYQYLESDLQAVNPRSLAAFEAGGLAEGDYLVEVRGWHWDGANYLPMPVKSQTIHVFNGYRHTELDPSGNPFTILRPQVSLSLQSIVDCGDAVVGDTITGNFSVSDNFFGYASIALVPITVGGNPVPENAVHLFDPASAALPNPVIYDGSNTSGVGGTFRLDTSGMVPCGYTIELYVEDRALVDSHCWHHANRIGVGFCLRAKSPPVK